ncbi:putative phage terminase large subunit-like protein [Eubacterium multiforme]|uniref:Phage terminase large subunit-like protein n=1 Tax=Eubacterium multiforme TaxID=83339 RepID=A0ABT9UUQ1_9FIRM|nr:hypothetical protein [Eubacterium multiforme]MDQ0150045.1 putative phage terminase large subunit-like protein [Eubacterium multiforme]
MDIYLICKYWNKHNKEAPLDLNKENDVKLILKNKKRLARAIGEIDIAFFGFYYLNKFFIAQDNEPDNRESSPTHLAVIEELNKMFVKDEYDRELFVLPRGFAKSTVVNKLLSCWLHCYKKSKFTIIIGKTERDTQAFIFDTRKFLECKKIAEEFGVLIDTRTRKVNADNLELTNDTMISAKAYNSTIRGTVYNRVRPQVIVCDDVLKQDDVNSDESKQKIVDKFYKEIVESGDKANYNKRGVKIKADTKFIVLGTPLANGDFIETIGNDATFKTFRRGVVDFDIDDYFLNNEYWIKYRSLLLNIKDPNNVKTAEVYYLDNIDKMQFTTIWSKYRCSKDIANSYFTNRLSFMQELMCDTSKVGDVWITNTIELPEEEILKYKCNKTILTIDQAASNNSKSDFTAMTTLGKYNNFYIVKEGSLYKFDSKLEFDLYIETVLDKLRANKDITHVFLEKNVYKGVDATRIEEGIAADSALRGRKIKVITIYNTKNKDERIMTITDKINSGMVFFNEKNTEYNKQVKDFKGQKFSLHDDAIDSLEMAINNIDTIKVIKRASMTFVSRALLKK